MTHSINIHAELIAQSRAGDAYAQSELYKLYSKAMYNVAYRITNDTNDAEDALQEAFISAFRNLKSYKEDATFGAWLKRIVVNKAINLIRKRNIQFVEVDEELVCDDQEVNYSADQLDVKRIMNAMEMLPHGYRMVFSLYLIEGYDHSEIAQILGITESTSKSQFNRSKKKIREILTEEVRYERSV